jgi:c-di-GMP-binding flagellar brake protein YcgR
MHLPEVLETGGERVVHAILRPDPATATRLQRRAWFRLSGRWPVRLRRQARGAARAGREQRACAFDLSAGGMLLGAVEGEPLEPGARIDVALDLDDGERALSATVEIVREQSGPPPGCVRLWGGRFCGLGYAGERRILRRLHALYRECLQSEIAAGTARARAA